MSARTTALPPRWATNQISELGCCRSARERTDQNAYAGALNWQPGPGVWSRWAMHGSFTPRHRSLFASAGGRIGGQTPKCGRRNYAWIVVPLVYTKFHRTLAQRQTCSAPKKIVRLLRWIRPFLIAFLQARSIGARICPSLQRLRCEPHPLQKSFHSRHSLHSGHWIVDLLRSHQCRPLWQAEQVKQSANFPS